MWRRSFEPYDTYERACVRRLGDSFHPVYIHQYAVNSQVPSCPPRNRCCARSTGTGRESLDALGAHIKYSSRYAQSVTVCHAGKRKVLLGRPWVSATPV